GGAGHLVVLVVADAAGGDAVMVQQFLGLPRVLAGDEIDFFQYAQRAQRDVLKVADGSSHEIQRRTWRQRTRIRGFVVAGGSGVHARSLPPRRGRRCSREVSNCGIQKSMFAAALWSRRRKRQIDVSQPETLESNQLPLAGVACHFTSTSARSVVTASKKYKSSPIPR